VKKDATFDVHTSLALSKQSKSSNVYSILKNYGRKTHSITSDVCSEIIMYEKIKEVRQAPKKIGCS
jgi:hypothetical protein